MQSETKSASGGEEKIEIKQVSKREIWVEENRFYLGEDNIIYVSVVGEQNVKIATAMNEVTLKLANMVEGKAKYLVDNNKAGKTSSEARKLFGKLTEDEKVDKIAIFGLHPVARVLASFLMGASKNKDMRFFNTKKEALAWLRE